MDSIAPALRGPWPEPACPVVVADAREVGIDRDAPARVSFARAGETGRTGW